MDAAHLRLAEEEKETLKRVMGPNGGLNTWRKETDALLPQRGRILERTTLDDGSCRFLDMIWW